MKRYILSLLFLTGAFVGASAQGEDEKSKDCQAYKDGHFVIKENLLRKKYAIKREGDMQIETDPNGTKFEFKVNWVDNCTYTLELNEILENPNDVEWTDGQIITVKILETDDKGYTQESTSNIDNLVFVKDIVKIDEKAYNRKVKNNEVKEEITMNN